MLRAQTHILVIDDDEVARESAQVLLRRWGHRVSLAANGEDGLTRLKASPPDLVLVDLQMPGIDGHEVLREVRETDPAIICIMVTGYATLQSAVEAMKQGAYDFLPKPFSPDELKLAVDRGLERRYLALETQALREEKARMEANFFTIVSHQLRSPLAAVRQLLEVAATESLGPLPEGYHEIFKRSVSRLDELLQDLNAWLSMRRLQADNISQAMQPLDLNDLLQELAGRVEADALAAGQKLVLTLPEGSAQLLADRETLLEALYNIASNAVKYNREGREVTISAVVAHHHVDINIGDQGPGIPEAERSFIFDDFFRSKSPELKNKPGTGLGLSIARRVVKAHGGEISVSCPDEGGSVFTVSLPL